MIIVEDTDEEGVVTRTQMRNMESAISLFMDLTESAMTVRVVISGFTLCKWRRPVEVEGEAILAELIKGDEMTTEHEWTEPMPWQASEEQLEREFVRRTVRQGIESMKENDMLFLKVMVSVLYHELVQE